MKNKAIERLEDSDVIQVVMLGSLAKRFEEWLNSRNLVIFELPLEAGGSEPEDDLRTFCIGLGPEAAKEAFGGTKE